MSYLGDTRSKLLGARFIVAQPQLRALAAVGMIASVVLLPFLALLLPVLAIQVFHNPTLLGVCLSAFGGSAMVGALAFARLSRVCSRAVIFYGGLLFCGAAIALCGLVASQVGVVICAAMAGLLLGSGNPLEQTILQEVTPRAIAGQVFTALGAIRFAAGPLGLLLAGLATETLGAQRVLVVAGVLLAATALLGWWFGSRFGSLRNSNRSPRS